MKYGFTPIELMIGFGAGSAEQKTESGSPEGSEDVFSAHRPSPGKHLIND